MEQDINSLSGIEFEKVCQQLVEYMGFETETTKASGDGGIDLIAYNHQPLLSGKYIIQCKRYTGSVGEPIIRDLYGVITSERANKGILMTTGYFTKSAISFANGKPIELIDGKKLDELLKNNGMFKFKDKISRKNSINVNWDIDNGNSEEVNFYDYHKQLFYEHIDELLYQLTFLEVAVSRLYTEVWDEGNIEVQLIINDFYDAFKRINIKGLNEDTKFLLLFLITHVLFLEKKFDILINKYYALLKWKKLTDSINEYNGLDGTYFAVAYNLVQILLLLNREDEANNIRVKNQKVFENQIDYFDAQIGFDEETTERYLKLKKVTLSKEIGYFWFCQFAVPSITYEYKGGGIKKDIFDNHYSYIYQDCIEHMGNFSYESSVFWNEVYFIHDSHSYYLETYKNGNVFLCEDYKF